MNITSKDLNLLKIFVAVSEELNLTRASKRLGLSQPALSHALGRLRDELGGGDPLFVRASRGLTATRRAGELLSQARQVLELADSLYAPAGPADFRSLKRAFVLGATTYFELRILDRLTRKLAAEAPGVALETRALQGEIPKEALERGEMDVAVAAYFEDVPESFRVKHLGRDPFVGLARARHPFLRGKRSLTEYLACAHLKINIPPGALAHIDRALAAKGEKRRIAVNAGNFLTPPITLQGNDLLLTCPESLARSYAAHFPGLELFELPVKLPPLEVRMIWHERAHADPFQKWVRALLPELLE